jgi:hypothetical protein
LHAVVLPQSSEVFAGIEPAGVVADVPSLWQYVLEQPVNAEGEFVCAQLEPFTYVTPDISMFPFLCPNVALLTWQVVQT